jgi:hypothetical protein
MNRIRNSFSFDVVYFQHGIVDSNTTWVVHGPGESIAFAAYDDGCDVFMGNFRGVYPRKVSPWREKMQNVGKADYWFYSIDHLAKYDIRAFIESIFNIKVEDYKRSFPDECANLNNKEIRNLVRSKLKITYIGHSLGGMLLSMYIIYSKLRNLDHYLSSAILLSPCGTHFHANWGIKLFG